MNSTTEKDKIRILIPFIGGFSSGKSSLINALLGENILSTDITPETALPVELSTGASKTFSAYKQGAVAEILNLDNLLDEDFTELAQAGGWLQAQLPQLKDWPLATLVDLPGWSSGESAHERQLDDYLLRLSKTHLDKHTLYVITVSADEGTLRDSTKERVESLDMGNSPYVLVITKTDKRTSKELNSVCLHVTEMLTKTMAKAPEKVVLSSARKKQVDELRTAISEALEAMLPKHRPQVDKQALKSELDWYLKELSDADSSSKIDDFAAYVWDDTWDELDYNILDRCLNYVYYPDAKLRAENLAQRVEAEWRKSFEKRFLQNYSAAPASLIEKLQQLSLTAPESFDIKSLNTDTLRRVLKEHMYLAVKKSKPGIFASSEPEAVGERLQSKVRGMKDAIVRDLRLFAIQHYYEMNTPQKEAWQRIRELVG